MLTKRFFRISVLLCIMIFMAFFVSGCWDRKEIENRGIVLGVAIDDVISSEPKGQYDLSHVTQEAGSRKYRVTFELPKLKKKGEEKTGGAEQHRIIAGEGESIFAISRAMNAKMPVSLFFEDIQIMVFSESIAKKGINEFLDYFVRNPAMRRRVKLLVTPGRAEDILKNKIKASELNGIYIAKITKNVNSTPRFASKTDLTDISSAIRNQRSFFMPMIVLEKGDVKLTRAALFNRDGKMVGDIDERAIIGAKILRKVLKGGVFSIPNPVDPEKLAVFEMLESETEVNSYLENGKLGFALEVRFVGNLGENTATEQEALDKDFLAAVEQVLAAEFTHQVEMAYYKQQELKVEACDLGELVHRQHPWYWKQIKDRWDDEIFPTVPLEVKIKVIIRRTGITV